MLRSTRNQDDTSGLHAALLDCTSESMPAVRDRVSRRLSEATGICRPSQQCSRRAQRLGVRLARLSVGFTTFKAQDDAGR